MRKCFYFLFPLRLTHAVHHRLPAFASAVKLQANDMVPAPVGTVKLATRNDCPLPRSRFLIGAIKAMNVTQFLDHHFRHFNARELVAAAKSYRQFVSSEQGGKMMVTLAGAMSTGELGLSLSEMIRKGKVHAITCTAANLEEDMFNLVAHNEYRIVENWRALSTEDEVELRDEGFNRVTDTCIPETVMRHIEGRLMTKWKAAAEQNQARMPVDFMFDLLDDESLVQHYQIPREHSWLAAAKDMGIPVFTPGFEDSTLGNIFAARVIDGSVAGTRCRSPPAPPKWNAWPAGTSNPRRRRSDSFKSVVGLPVIFRSASCRCSSRT